MVAVQNRMGNSWRQGLVLSCCFCAMIRNSQMVSENRIPRGSDIPQNAAMVQVLENKDRDSELEPTHGILGSVPELVHMTLDFDDSWWNRERSAIPPVDSSALEDSGGD